MQTTIVDFAHARAATVAVLGSISRQQEAKLLITIEDLIGSVSAWPAFIRESLLSTHLRFRERFQLTLFWLPPMLAVQW